MPTLLCNLPTCKATSMNVVPALGSCCKLCYREVCGTRACNAAHEKYTPPNTCDGKTRGQDLDRRGSQLPRAAMPCGLRAGRPAHQMSHQSISELGALSGCTSASFATPDPALPKAEARIPGSQTFSAFILSMSNMNQRVCMQAARTQQLDAASRPSSSVSRLSRASSAFPPTSTLQALRKPKKT